MIKTARLISILALAALPFAAPAWAEPGLASEVYGAGVTRGETEIELRAGYLTGGAGDGEWAAIAEAARGVTDWWRPALLLEMEREPGEDAVIEAVAFENVFDITATRAWPVHLGAYVEYERNTQSDPDKIELRALMQRQRGPLDLRLNLIGEREIGAGSSNAWEYGYAAMALWAVNGDLSLGVEGFGDAGTDSDFGAFDDHAHYWGPVAEFEVLESARGEIEAHIGYLFGSGDAEADGQIRFILEWEH